MGLGRYEEALESLQQASEESSKAFGRVHTDTLSIINDLGSCLERMGRAAEALPLRRRALAASQRTLGRAHPTTKLFLSNLANHLTATRSAISAWRRAEREGTSSSDAVQAALQEAGVPTPGVAAAAPRPAGVPTPDVAAAAPRSAGVPTPEVAAAAPRPAGGPPEASAATSPVGSAQWVDEWAPAPSSSSRRRGRGGGGRGRGSSSGRQQEGHRGGRGEGQPSRLPPPLQQREREREPEQGRHPGNLDALAPLPPGLVARPWSELRGGSKGGEDCAICLEGLGCSLEGGPLVVRLSCCHSYCEVCLRAYIRVMGGAGAAMACPQCRGAIG